MHSHKSDLRASGRTKSKLSRRNFLKRSGAVIAVSASPSILTKAAENEERIGYEEIPLKIEINGTSHSLSVEPRTTLLDLLREKMDLTGTKKGCDYGQCGACTVLVNGERILSCLSLAIMQQDKKVTTIEGLAQGNQLHPMQEAFLRNDGLQCGYCTPGQILSGIACISEGHAKTLGEVREYMSGNICRCGAYPNITAAIMEVQKTGISL